MNEFCSGCGNSLTPGDRFCRNCGKDSTAAPGAVQGDDPIAPAIPVAPGTPVIPGTPPETSGKAILSLVCGLFFFIPLAFVGAIVLGHLALSEIRKSAGRLKGEGLAIAGLVLGYLWIVGIPMILIIAAIAIPNLLRARMAANESSAVAGVRTLVVAEVTYSSNHQDAGFTCSLSDLAGERLIAGSLASGQKNGYAFELSDCSPEAGGGANVKYRVVAYPVTRNTTGVRAFCADESSVIKVDSSGSPQDCVENGSTLQ